MLDEILRNAMSDIPNCVAMGVIDLNSGTLLAIEAEEERSQEMLNVMTSTVTELFEAPLLQAFSEIYAADAKGNPDAGRDFTELVLLNSFHNYLLLRGRNHPQIAVIVITKKDTPVGLLRMKALSAMPDIENAV